MKAFRYGAVIALFFAVGCVLDNTGTTTVAGGEDFPNTIGKVTAADISSHSNWDQFQGIDTTPNLSSDSLAASVTVASKQAMAIRSAIAAQDTVVISNQSGITVTKHLKVNTGDGKWSSRSDNRLQEYDLLRSRQGDTLEWTQLVGAYPDSALWTAGGAGVVVLNHQVKTPASRPQVARIWTTLKASVTHFGKTSTVLSYTERCVWTDGDTTLLTIKGVRGDSLLAANDTSYVTFDRMSSISGSPLISQGRYWVRVGKLARPFLDNAMLRFEIINHWSTGTVRYDSIAFAPDSPVLSGELNIHGSFRVLAHDSTGANGEVAGIYRNDTIQTNMRETRNGTSKNYHMVYGGDGMLKERDDLPDNDSDEVVKPKRIDYDEDDLPVSGKSVFK